MPTSTLVLNRVYQAVRFAKPHDAIRLVSSGRASVVVGNVNYDWKTRLAKSHELEPSLVSIGTTYGSVRVPKVVRLTAYDENRLVPIGFTRKAILERDHFTCQYCGKALTLSELSLDRVIPRDRGGPATWENTVSSCRQCDSQKANRTPNEAGLKLNRKPRARRSMPNDALVREGASTSRPLDHEWLPYFAIVADDLAHNEAELLVGAVNAELIKYLQKHPEKIHGISPYKFEELIAELLRDMGCDVQLTPKSRDKGRDVLAELRTPVGNMLVIVECKKWALSHNIGTSIVERFLWTIEHQDKATLGIIATTSIFSRDASALERANRWKLQLRDYHRIREWLNRYGCWTKQDNSLLWTPERTIIHPKS